MEGASCLIFVYQVLHSLFVFSLVPILSRVSLSVVRKDGRSYGVHLTAEDLSIDRRYCGDLSIS